MQKLLFIVIFIKITSISLPDNFESVLFPIPRKE